MFETIFKDFQQAKDVHITGLLADLMNQTPWPRRILGR